MAKMTPSVVTKVGEALVSGALATGEKINFTRIVTSDKDYSAANLNELTEIANIKLQSLVSYQEITEDGKMRAECAVMNGELTTGYLIRTIALYAKTQSKAEVLFAVSIAESDDKADYMEAFNGKIATGAYLRMLIAVSSTDCFLLEIDPAAVASVGDIVRHNKDTQAHPDIQQAIQNGKTDLAAHNVDDAAHDNLFRAFMDWVTQQNNNQDSSFNSKISGINSSITSINSTLTKKMNISGGTFTGAVYAPNSVDTNSSIRNIWVGTSSSAAVNTCRIDMRRK